TNPLPPTTDGSCTLRDLLRSGVSYWASFTPKRVHHAVALHCSRFRPELPVEEGKESSMEGFIPCEAPAERRRSRTCKDKHIAVDGDAAGVKFFPEYILGDYLSRGEPIDIDGLLGSDVPAAEGGSSKGPEFTKASRMIEISRFPRPRRGFGSSGSRFPFSLDTVEAKTGGPDEMGEVNQPSVPLNVDDYSMGGSMTGYYEFDG
ncbi:hypothetical protein HID58_048281, partial [Brassica napus]